MLRQNKNRNHAPISQNTVIEYLKDIRIFFNFMLERDMIKINPIKKNRYYKLKPHYKEVIEIPSAHIDLIEAYLIDRSMPQYRIIHFLRLTAMRVTDALDLKWHQIYFDQKYISHRIAKTNTPQKIPLYPQLLKFLKSFKQPDGYLFDYRSRSSLKFFQTALKNLDLPKYNLHQIR